MRLTSFLALSIAWSLPACSSSTPTDGDGDVDGDTDGDSDGDTDGDSDGDSDGETDGDSDGDLEPTCEPATGEVSLGWSIETVPVGETDLETPCRVEAVTSEEVGHSVVTLECGTGAAMETHVLDVTVSPSVYVSLVEDQEVTLRYVAQPIWWINRFFTLRSPGGSLIMAGVSADRIAPEGETVAAWYDPIGLEVVSGVCAAEAVSCGTAERQGLMVSFGDAVQTILEGESGYVGMMVSIEVILASAHLYHEMECDDVPMQYYEALFVVIPEG